MLLQAMNQSGFKKIHFFLSDALLQSSSPTRGFAEKISNICPILLQYLTQNNLISLLFMTLSPFFGRDKFETAAAFEWLKWHIVV